MAKKQQLAVYNLPKMIPGSGAPEESKAQKRARRLREKGDVLSRSILSLKHSGTASRRQLKLLWGKSHGCPLWKQERTQKKCKETGKLLPLPVHPKTKKTLKFRANRVLSSSTIKTLASGAAASVAKMIYEESKDLRCATLPENTRYPMQPAFGEGPSMAVEAALVAYLQEIFKTAIDIKKEIGKHEKVSAKSMHAAACIVNRKIAAATGYVPPTIVCRHTIKKKRRSKKKMAQAASVDEE